MRAPGAPTKAPLPTLLGGIEWIQIVAWVQKVVGGPVRLRPEISMKKYCDGAHLPVGGLDRMHKFTLC